MPATVTSSHPTRRRGALLAGALLVALTGCTAHATLTVTVHADGSGTVAVRVALDPEAVHAAQGDGTPLEQRVRLADLRSAGWTVSRWTHRADGSATIALTKPFQRPAQLAQIAHELSGTDGPVPSLHAARDARWLGVAHTITVAGKIDLRDATGGLATDQELVARLTGQRVDLGAITQQLTGQARTAVSVRVVVAVPGHRSARTVAAGQVATVGATSTAVDSTRVGLFAGAALLAALAGLAWHRGRRAGRGTGGAATRDAG